MAATGKAAGVNPEAWKIIDGKLFLHWDQKGGNEFAAKADEEVKRADQNWAKLRKE